MSTTTPTRYSTRQVCDAAGVTYRQLDYWVRRGLIAPSIRNASGSGSRRDWSSHDLAIVRILGVVLGGGRLPIVKASGLVGFLSDLPLQQWAATSIVLDLDGDVWLSGDAAPKVGLHVDLSLIFDETA